MNTLRLLGIVLFAWLWGAGPGAAAPATARGVQGVVLRVGDGDSLNFAPVGQAGFEVRLRDIDAPELCQPWGAEAHRALKALALNKTATLLAAGRDRFGRTLGVLWVEGVDVGQRLVAEGHAWSIRTRFDRGPLVKEERMAKALGRGLHGQLGALTPEQFRRAHGPCAPSEVATPAVPGDPKAPPSARRTGAPMNTAFRCDGRTQCSQMTSCEEAKFFDLVCPDVKMERNRDGVPCEKQWCGAQR